MKHIVLTILLLFSMFVCQSQNHRDGCGYHATNELGISFRSEYYCCPEEGCEHIMEFCDDCRKSYYINGLPISKNEIISLKLKNKDLNIWDCMFYPKQTEDDCISEVEFHISTKLPIYINGTEYSEQNTDVDEELKDKTLNFKKEKERFKKKIMVKYENEK